MGSEAPRRGTLFEVLAWGEEPTWRSVWQNCGNHIVQGISSETSLDIVNGCLFEPEFEVDVSFSAGHFWHRQEHLALYSHTQPRSIPSLRKLPTGSWSRLQMFNAWKCSMWDYMSSHGTPSFSLSNLESTKVPDLWLEVRSVVRPCAYKSFQRNRCWSVTFSTRKLSQVSISFLRFP